MASRCYALSSQRSALLKMPRREKLKAGVHFGNLQDRDIFGNLLSQNYFMDCYQIFHTCLLTIAEYT